MHFGTHRFANSSTNASITSLLVTIRVLPASVHNAKSGEFFRRLQAIDPHPTTELEYSSTFELLFAVIL